MNIRDDKRIEAIDLDDGSMFVMLRPGHAYSDANTDNACHCFGADTDADIEKALATVQPCECSDCLLADATTGSMWS